MFRRFLKASKRKLDPRNHNKEPEVGDEEASPTVGRAENGGILRRKGRRSVDSGIARAKNRLSLDEDTPENRLQAPEPRRPRGSYDDLDINSPRNERSPRIGPRTVSRSSGEAVRRSPARRSSRSVEDGSSETYERKIERNVSQRDDLDSDTTPTRITRRSSSRRDSPSTSTPPSSRKSRIVRKSSSVRSNNLSMNSGGSPPAGVSPEQIPVPEPKLVRRGSAGGVLDGAATNRMPRTRSSGRSRIAEHDQTTRSPLTRKRTSADRKSAAKGARRLSLDEAAVRGRKDSERRTSRGISAELEGEAVRGLDVDPSHGLQKGLPLGIVSEDEHFRRLSLDGDLPQEARRPDATPGKPEGEGVIYIGDGEGGFGGGVHFGACSKAGWEPHRTGRAGMTSVEVRKENQDAYFVYAPFERHSEVLLGVFDGHGSNGRTVAQYVRDTVPKAMSVERVKYDQYDQLDGHVNENGSESSARLPDVETNQRRVRALKAAFNRAERGLQGGEAAPCDHVFSGTTAVVAWIIDNKHIYTAWAGDSRCILGRKAMVTTRAGHTSDAMMRTKFRAVELSHDQKPVRSDEKKRVRQAGGRVARWRRNIGPLRVWLPRDWVPGLAMTRSIGDTVLSDFGVSPIPEVSYAKLTPLDSFVVLASDGVWEFMNSEEVADFVGRWRKEEKDPTDAAEALVREAVRRWRRQEVVVDDTTAVVVWLDGESAKVGQSGYHADSPRSGYGGSRRRYEETGTYIAKKKLWPFGRDKREEKDKVWLVRDDGRFMQFHCRNDLLMGQ